ncbi:MAG TPA: DUF6084 family protein [Ktedonobacteraceae bacterium]
MPDLDFAVVGAEVPPFAALPTLIFKLSVTNAPAHQVIHSISLRSQIQLAVNRRRYSPAAQPRLVELFGEPQRWGDTLRPLLWTHASTVVPRFSDALVADIPIACTYDLEVASTKYFDALDEGEIPLAFFFSGSVFYENDEGNLQVEQIPWSKEAFYRLPVATWKEMIARYYPNSAWLRLHKDVFDQLYQYKTAQGLPTWDDVITRLLVAARGPAETVAPAAEALAHTNDEEVRR